MSDLEINLKSQVSVNHYIVKDYDSKERFISYWHQINEIIDLNPNKVLEIGIGNGFVSKYLKERSIDIVTADANADLKPDVVCDTRNLLFEDSSFDVVVCFEVLEHIHYNDFAKALSEIFRVTKNNAIISLPDSGRVISFSLYSHRFGYFRRIISLPRLNKPLHKYDGQHYWEIGKKGYPLATIVSDIKNCGFKVNKTYRPFENPYHRFFVLRKP